MLEDKLKSVKVHGANATILCLGLATLIPLITHLGAARERSETVIASICIVIWVTRRLTHSLSSVLNQQNTYYLWALHTQTRLQNNLTGHWHERYKNIFQRKTFLVIGNKHGGKSQMLINAGSSERQSSFEYQDKGLVTHSIWSYKQHTLLETTCLMPVNNDTKQLQTSYWRNVLNLHKWNHCATGFNGLVVVLSIQSILNEKKSHPTQSIAALRAQIENLTQSTSTAPLFFIITGLDHLSGFHEFFKSIDKEDINRPLGFTIPPKMQQKADIQLELDRVANDIEAYLIFQLERVALGDHSDVEKMHSFHENFKSLKPKIIQILYSLKTCVKNPIAGMFFTSHTERNQQETPDHNHISQFYKSQKQSYFNKQLLATIDQHTIWQPSKKLQQIVLLGIILLSWSTSNISLNQTVVRPLQESTSYFFQGTKTGKSNIQEFNQPSTVPLQPSQNRSTTLDSKTKSNSTQALAPTKKSTYITQRTNTRQDQLNRVWDIVKQTLDADINQCDLLRQPNCQKQALGLLSLQKSSTLTPNIVKILVTEPAAIITLMSKITDSQILPLNSDQLEEVGYLIKKIQKQIVISPNQPINKTVIESINKEFYQYDALKQIQEADGISQQACQALNRIHTIAPIPNFSPVNCVKTVQQNIQREAFGQIATIYRKAMSTQLQNDNILTLQKKADYLSKNTNLIASSMQQAQKELISIKPQSNTFDADTKHDYDHLLSQLQRFDEKVYKKVLTKVTQLTQEINQSRNADMAALQLLEQLLSSDKSDKTWPRAYRELDQISQHTIQSLEECIINSVSKLLSETWKHTIHTPYKEELQANFPFAIHAERSVPLETFNDFFNNQGIMNGFHLKYLHPLIDTHKENGPQWKKLHGKSLPFNPNIPSFIMGTTIIQKMFYPNNTPTLWFEGVLRYRHASDQVQAIEITQDHARQQIKPGQTSPVHVKWPHAKERFGLAIVLKSGQRVQLVEEEGEWGMIKFLMKHSHANNNKKSRIINVKHTAYPVELEFETQASMHPLSASLNSFFQVPEDIAITKN
jgi:type VI protein secretion system component VasK